jgi:hypothetical protein
MGKLAPDGMIDASLDYVAGSNYECVCSGSPATFADAYTNLMLARVAVTSGSFTKADAAGGGRQVTIAAKPGITITNSGTALAVAMVEASGSTLRYVTTCTSQALVAAGTVDIPAWIITIGDPT